MKTTTATAPITIQYIVVAILAVFFSWVLHEFAHWAAGTLLGNEMTMTLNTGYPVARSYIHESDAGIVSIAGPIITLLQTVIVYYMLRQNLSYVWFSFLLTPLYMRFLAAVLNLVNLNDEGRVSKALGIGTFTLPIIVVAILFALNYGIIKRRLFSTKLIVVTVFIIMLISSIIILADQAYKIHLIN